MTVDTSKSPEKFFSPLSKSSVKKYIVFHEENEHDDLNEDKTDHFGGNSFERWVVVGTDSTYIVSEDFCSCYSFILDNLKKINQCKHITMLLEAKQSKNYDTFQISTEEYERIRSEWLKTI